jgi:hypothetical protein
MAAGADSSQGMGRARSLVGRMLLKARQGGGGAAVQQWTALADARAGLAQDIATLKAQGSAAAAGLEKALAAIEQAGGADPAKAARLLRGLQDAVKSADNAPGASAKA